MRSFHLRRKKSKSYIVKRLFGVLVSIALIVFIYSKLDVVIKSYDCSTQYGPCTTSRFDYLSSVVDSRYTLAKRNITEILSNDPLVKENSIKLKLPNILVINIIESVPVAAIKRDKDFLLINEDGVVIKTSETTSLPFLTIKDNKANFSEGSTVTEDIKFALNVIRYISKNHNIINSNLYDDVLKIDLKSSITATFPLFGDERVLAGALLISENQLLVGDFESRIGNRGMCIKGCEIDFRFDNPVIRNLK